MVTTTVHPDDVLQGGAAPRLDYIAEPLRPLAVPIASLTLDAANARKHGEKNLEAIVGSLSRFGQRLPVVVQKQGMIVRAGNGRVEAARRLGWSHIAAVVVDESAVEATAFAIADNRASDLSEWNEEALASLLNTLPEDVLPSTGFGKDDLDELLAGLAPEVVEDEAPEPLPDPVSQTGDLWVMGEHRLLCGDSTKAEDVAAVLGGCVLEALITDPPYGISVVGRNGKIGADGLAKTNVYPSIIGDDKPFDPSHLVSAADSVVLFGANHFSTKLPASPGWIVWDKRDGMASNAFADVELAWTNNQKPARLFRHMWSGMIKKGERDNRCHPTQKPIALMGWVISEYAACAECIGDWYSGSGTTLIACEQLGRKCFAIEIEPRYVDVAVRRWEKLTGKHAILDGTNKTWKEVAHDRGVSIAE